MAYLYVKIIIMKNDIQWMILAMTMAMAMAIEKANISKFVTLKISFIR